VNEDFKASYTTDVVENNQLDSPNICQQPISSPLPPESTISSTLSPQPSTSAAFPQLPMASKKKTRKPRKKLPSYHISGSAVKQALETKKKEKQLMELKKQDRLKKKAETLAIKKSKGVPKTPGKRMTTKSTRST
jgi:hypothetical protein